MTALERVVADVAAARRELARMPGHHRDAVLLEMADALERRSAEILRENRLDVEAAKRGRAAPALIDRLLLDEDRVADMARGVRKVAALPDPIGAWTEAGGCRTASSWCAAACRSASSRWSTRGAPTSPSMPSASASRAATR